MLMAHFILEEALQATHLNLSLRKACECTSRVSHRKEDHRAAFDVSKAQRLLGWHQIASLEEGIRQWAQCLTQK